MNPTAATVAIVALTLHGQTIDASEGEGVPILDQQPEIAAPPTELSGPMLWMPGPWIPGLGWTQVAL